MPNPSYSSQEHPAAAPEPAAVLSISELNRMARTSLERSFPLLRVVGEVSNLARAASGHMYFTLKDENAQVRCTMWRNRAQLLPFQPSNGMQVEARALVTLYEARGDFQLSVEGLRQAGTGNLYEAFLRLRDKLQAEGLFDPAGKRALPQFPRRIGVITSPAAAALQDVLAALRRRAPHLEVVLYPAPVQGEGAAQRLCEALAHAAARRAEDDIDTLLLVRGGGSLEDLSAFNDEALARAIKACPLPVVCGVGHETDLTIADFVADVRAATPTGAAELASAGFHESARRLAVLADTLSSQLRRRIDQLTQRLDQASLRFKHPRERLALSRDAVSQLQRRLETALQRRLERAGNQTQLLGLRLTNARPDLHRAAAHHARCAERLTAAAARLLATHEERLKALAAHLAHLGPPGVLARGYSITRDASGNIVRSAAHVSAGNPLSIELSQGQLAATVTRSTH